MMINVRPKALCCPFRTFSSQDGQKGFCKQSNTECIYPSSTFILECTPPEKKNIEETRPTGIP